MYRDCGIIKRKKIFRNYKNSKLRQDSVDKQWIFTSKDVIARMYTSYEEAHKLSLEKPTEFWAKEAEKIHWYQKYDQVLDDSNYPFFRWFPGGKTNLCYNAVDRYAFGSKRGTTALIWESPETGQSKIFTFYHLYKEVNKCRSTKKSRCTERRQNNHLHAHGARSNNCYACICSYRRCSLCCVCRF